MTKNIFLLLMLIAGTFVLFGIYKHAPHNVHWYPPCLFKKLSGFDCPGCGGTRATYHLLHGDFAMAANHNILFLILLPVSVTGVAALFYDRFRGTWQYFNKPLSMLILVLMFWVIRNLPYFPFEWLHSDK